MTPNAPLSDEVAAEYCERLGQLTEWIHRIPLAKAMLASHRAMAEQLRHEKEQVRGFQRWLSGGVYYTMEEHEQSIATPKRELEQKLADVQAYASRLEKEKWQLLRAIDEVLTPSMVDLACQYVGELKQSLVNAQARCRELQAVVDSLPRTLAEQR